MFLEKTNRISGDASLLINFCNYLEYTYGSGSTNILVVGHMDIINICLGYFMKKTMKISTFHMLIQI